MNPFYTFDVINCVKYWIHKNFSYVNEQQMEFKCATLSPVKLQRKEKKTTTSIQCDAIVSRKFIYLSVIEIRKSNPEAAPTKVHFF